MMQYWHAEIQTARRAKPVEDWHFAIEAAYLLREFEWLRGLWMMQFLPGHTFRQRLPSTRAMQRVFLGESRWDLNKRVPNLDVQFESAARAGATGALALIEVIEEKFREAGKEPPARPPIIFYPHGSSAG